jgi:hypothetical protein
VESAIKTPMAGEWPIVPAKVRHDSQGSLPKTAAKPYLDDIALEL